MLRPTRKISLIFICLFTVTASVVVEKGTRFTRSKLASLLMVWDTKCTFGYLDNVTKNYAPNPIVRQLAYKINNQSLKENSVFASVTASGTDLV